MHIQTTTIGQLDGLKEQQQGLQVPETTTASRTIFMSGSGPTNGGDFFDGSAEPVVYMSENRMPVMIEFNSAIIYIIFAALLLALVSILPGIRRTKLTSFIGLLTMLLVGASVLLAIEGSHWLSGSVQINEAPYGALTMETITGKLEVNIGLSSTNITLMGRLMGTLSANNNNNTNHVDYNERFHWDKPNQMASEHVEALRKGLPYPILTITEFLSQDADGFNWMRQLRQAGYFTSLALYLSLASWCLTTIIMCVLPVYLPHMMQITGALMMGSVWVYTLLIQSPESFVIQLGGKPIEFAFGYTYVITFVAGALSMFAGILLFVIRLGNPNDQLTIMDCDQFVKDQKALYGGNLTLIDNVHDLTGKKVKPTLEHQNSVIIPISDIEEKFNTAKAAA